MIDLLRRLPKLRFMAIRLIQVQFGSRATGNGREDAEVTSGLVAIGSHGEHINTLIILKPVVFTTGFLN